MKIATFNVNSLRVRLPATLDWLASAKPTILGIQETKMKESDFPYDDLKQAGWHSDHLGQGGYNGVALISSHAPDEVRKGLRDGVKDPQARLIEGRWGDLWVVNTYVPQGFEVGSDKYQYKLEWLDRLLAYLREHHDPKAPLAWIGDFNVAVEDIDCYSPDYFAGGVSLSDAERSRLEALREWGFTDCFRQLHPGKEKQYTFFDYRVRDSVKFRRGWRIDHIWVTQPMAERLTACEIDMAPRLEERASDHTPLWAEFREPA